MRKYVNNLRAKPEHIRKQAVFVVMAVAVVLICGLWVYSLSHRFGKQTSVKVSEDVKPFAMFGQSIKSSYLGLTASLGNSGILGAEKKNEGKMIPLTVVPDTQ